MKRFSSSDSLGSLICPPKEENHCYNKEFQEMLDSSDQEEYSGEELMNMAKKKRLRSDQVKALERNFEVENKLDPERKVKLAQELGLQPRQVAIWFQNRRARWKTKQMEKDYWLLKSNHDALKLNYENLQKHNQALNEKLRELKAKVCRESTESFESVKEESPILGFENIDGLDNGKDSNVQENNDKEGPQLYASLKLEDGSSLHGIIRKEKNLGFNGSTSSSSSSSNSIMNWFQLSKSEAFPVKMSQSQFERMEEQSLLFSSEEPCNFLSVDQAPTLHWH